MASVSLFSRSIRSRISPSFRRSPTVVNKKTRRAWQQQMGAGPGRGQWELGATSPQRVHFNPEQIDMDSRVCLSIFAAAVQKLGKHFWGLGGGWSSSGFLCPQPVLVGTGRLRVQILGVKRFEVRELSSARLRVGATHSAPPEDRTHSRDQWVLTMSHVTSA